MGILIASFLHRMSDVMVLPEKSETLLVVTVWVFVFLSGLLLFISPYRVFNFSFQRYPFIETFEGMLVWTAVRGVGMCLGVALGCILIYRIGSFFIPRRGRRRRGREGGVGQWVAVIALLAIPGTSLGAWVLRGIGTEDQVGSPSISIVNPTQRVIVIGWEGAGWEAIDPLLKEDQLPNLQAMIERGYQARVQSSAPAHSIRIFPELMSGQPPEQHGIINSVAYRIPFFRESFLIPQSGMGLEGIFKILPFIGSRPVNSLDRKEPVVWELADEAGLTVGVIEGLTSFPAKKVEGYLVSDRAYRSLQRAKDEKNFFHLKERGFDTYPPELLTTLQADFEWSSSPSLDLMSRMARLNGEELKNPPKTIPLLKREGWKHLWEALGRDQYRYRVGRSLWRETRPDFASVTMNGLDRIQHHLWKYQEPEKFWGVNDSLVQTFQSSITEYYQWLDDQLGGWIQEASEEVNFVLLSGFGQGPVFGGTRGRSGDHHWGPEGILVMSGPQFQSNTQSGERPLVYVRDVAPTVLYLLGLPISEELPGQLLSTAIHPSLLQKAPMKKVERYHYVTELELSHDE